MNKLTPKEITRRINIAKAHLAQIGNSQTFRKEIELTEKVAEKEGIEAYWKLQDKLSRELANKLIDYKGSSEATAFCLKLADILNGIETPEEKWYRIRENIKEFLNSDEDIPKSESLKKLTEEAIAEDTMDGYYNLLKSFRKNYDELTKLKKSEENADAFLGQLTNIVYDRK
jgi:ferritin